MLSVRDAIANMAIISLFCKNFQTVTRPASLLGQISSRYVSPSLVFRHQVQTLAVSGQQHCVNDRRIYLSTPCSLTNSVQIRLFSQQPQDQLSPENHEEDFAEHEKTIYKGILATQIKLVKTFSLMTSVIGLACQPVLIMRMGENGGNIALMVASGAFLSFFTFATPLLIHWISKKYVVELIYNKIDDTYTAITYSLLLRKKEVSLEVKLFQENKIKEKCMKGH